MKNQTLSRTRIIAAFAALICTGEAGLASAQTPRADSTRRLNAIEHAIGKAGAKQPDGALKFSFPRSDLTVVARGVTLKPAFALGGWVAFKQIGGNRAMLMGDLVLTEAEVAPVISALQEGGVEQTALHNHLLMESPRVMYLHISATGDDAKLAATVRRAVALTGAPLGAGAPAIPSAAELDTAGIARALGFAGKLNGAVYQVSVPRPEPITDSGEIIPPSMGVSIAINFQPTGGGRAAITGDFVLTAGEVNPVLRALRAHGIEPTALHSHMLTEDPRLFFMHFWAEDNAVTLAKGLRAALDQVQLRKAISGNMR